MAKAINPSRMTFQLSFGHYGDGPINPNTGEATKVFAKDFECWAGEWSLNITQQLTLAGAGITRATVFFIRHNDEVQEKMLVLREKHAYQVDSIAADDGSQQNGFDLVTCHEVVVKFG